jgi:ubiquinone/menaquinone biosynthesis C-methylase UbiE
LNAEHLRICSSIEWGKTVEDVLMPWVLEGQSLGEHLIEVGPGPGLTTNLLRHKAPRLTAAEIDAELARSLGARMAGTNVAVVRTDGTQLPFPRASFSAAASFTMLHHVPTVELQDRLLAEVARVVRPGGVYMGVDSLDSPSFRQLHIDDICVPIDPATFPDRLRAAGFVDISVTVNLPRALFRARVPAQ